MQVSISNESKYLLIQNYDFFVKQIEPLYITFLTDRASGVRNTAIKAVPNFVKVFG